MKDKMPSVIAMLVVLALVYLSNSGKLLQIKTALQGPGDTGPTPGSAAGSGAGSSAGSGGGATGTWGSSGNGGLNGPIGDKGTGTSGKN